MGVVVALVATALPPRARAALPTERGLDLFVHAPGLAAGGEVLPIDVQALGFPTATTTVPLSGAAVEAAWDLESLLDPTQKDASPAAAPPSVRAVADDQGRATLLLPVPKGRTKAITLLVSIRSADRERVRELVVQRTAAEHLSLFVSDPQVVPGSEVVAWARWSSTDGSRPIENGPVEFVLTQGGVIRFRQRAKTDASGTVMARVPIPRDDEPGVEWVLTARAADRPPAEGDELKDAATLGAREETPGRPSLWSGFDEGRVVAGAKARYRVRVRDASGEGIAGHPVWVWTGPNGTSAPSDVDEFRKASKKLLTDGAGEIVSEIAAPTTIPLRGTQVHLEARTEIDGLARATTSIVDVGQRRGHANLTPEGGEIVPGLEQRLTLSLWGDDNNPLVGSFIAKGDGLDATFTTNDHGEAEVLWKAPLGIGAARNTGPCPGSVAAQVTLRAKDAESAKSSFGGALTDTAGMGLCVPVRRGATMLVRPEKLVVREGEEITVRVVGADKKPASILLTQIGGAQSVATWLKDAGAPARVKVPSGSAGTLTIHAAVPKPNGATEIASAAVLVLPARLPSVTAKISGGRAAPGGKVMLSAQLADETGKPMTGSVAAIMIDKLGGGSFGALASMDTKRNLCAAVGAWDERCDPALFGGPEMDPLRRTSLSPIAPIAPTSDPSANAKSQMDTTFAAVVRSLEGAVFEAARAQETLPDVRRKDKGKFTFNPELMTLVTDAMSDKPLTPGGEPVALADLIAIDKQITYDNVARRVARLKMFDVLSNVRGARTGLDPDEPILAEPNVFLRKLVRDGVVPEEGLLDPWGGQLSFFKAEGEHVPFVSVRRGWELRSPGPDGKMGTADDVKSPFERVVKSGTPYARAMNEDRVVDARYDMLVADATVEGWSQTLLESTGTALGDGIGLGNIGTIGHGSGQGFGSGSGRLGSSHRSTGPIVKGVAFVAAPIRTDAQGRVSIEIPLGDIETTWQVAVVGLPDGARTAMSTVDVPVTVPLSSKVNAGSSWTDGDRGEAVIQVRNRSDQDRDVSLAIASRGAIVVDEKSRAPRLKVAKRGVATVRIPISAKGSGRGYLDVRTTASGLPEDALTHELEVRPKGELLRIARTTWITEEHDLAAALDRRPFVAAGRATLILDRGDRSALEAALESLAPERNLSNEELAEIASTAGDLQRHFVALEGDGSKLASRAREIGRTATAKVASRVVPGQPLAFSLLGRTMVAGFLESSELGKALDLCPPEGADLDPSVQAAAFEAEPAPLGGAVRDCWTTFVARGTNQLTSNGTSGDLARAVLALARRPHRATELKTLTKELEKRVELDDDGNISVSASSSRAERALVYAALLVASKPGEEGTSKRARMLRWLLVQRDAGGSFGSAAATRGAVQAIVAASSELRGPKAPIEVNIDFGEGGEKHVVVKPDERVEIAIPANADEVRVMPSGGGVMARLERTFLRPYSVAPQPGDAPIALETEWPAATDCAPSVKTNGACPKELKQGRVGNLRLTVKELADKSARSVDVRIPLPPGATLADVTSGVRQVHGALYVRTNVSGETTVMVPIRFSLAGSFTVREATASVRDSAADAAIARARPLVIKP
ncbi:MAG: hypothetical protein HOW73_26405 [Polyangiaceae bacterium]|nr:hypothetical protein [Polyangiaceae bacterium]